ncbi:ferredoxin [Vescimonas fastidiosa]|jgi:ferredoxin|uniref:Ferredoxin n=1 Tax=Vescimonas fastidiosa TaxID=2714353 RepID=A0A810PVW8_9FIRM|nr:ferredoxin [Vescimonas fastidiosa]BCK78395.1 ferredoxin [Vescimonas fastidiosa]
MKAIVNQDTCIGCGLCISTVPEVFEVNADGKAEACGHTTDENRAAVQEAIDACPVQAISAED